MKLRNKKTGEIIETDFELSVSIPDDEKLYGNDTYTQLKGYSSIKELSEDWEDYEEPKEHYSITQFGEVIDGVDGYMSETIDEMKQIGNYFETKEEAEKAVEKLKSWKRLKDITTRIDRASIDIVGTATLFIRYEEKDHKKVKEALNLLFGGEE